ncbi:diguanylate cyclase [Jannaschia donghaensis]|uniref:diguanylate cyclase n=1 Tax=Jannaschia donghaensis TaxID=420998 RepID=A0A0M6YEL3_9RHOB|nr:diguanylate cyclase [Jannaschia donghaensis]CTQ48792.1 Stalked cell differentiation-controlling protein [Jannaschia donghaensis]
MTGRILIVDDVATNRIVMKVKLSAARYEVVPAASGAEALEIAASGGIDIVIMDMMMPGLTGAETCRRLRSDPATATIPVILVTASDDMDARMDGLSAGADDFLSKPVDELALLARVRSLLRSRGEEQDYRARGGDMIEMACATMPGMSEPRPGFAGKPAVVNDGRIALIGGPDATWLPVQRDRLRPLFRETVSIMNGDKALAVPEAEAPDLFLLDADMASRNDGLRLMSELRSRLATRHAAFMILLPKGDSERAATALDLGAADVSYHPFSADEIAMRVRTQLARKRRADRMRNTLDSGLKMAMFDSLTGLHNRHYGLHQLEQVTTRCRALGLRAGLILMDIDHFKVVNDTHGHPVGDAVLARVAQTLQTSLRAEDMVARIGGEEFLAILPDTDMRNVRAVAERLRAAIEAMETPLPGGGSLTVTLSLGAGLLGEQDRVGADALARIDRALYSAKDGGRNCVRLVEA